MSRRKEYLAYINSKKWKLFRQRIIAERGRQCQFCLKTPKYIHCHHRTYKRFGNEQPRDVVLLCRPCHKMVHKIHKQNGYRNLWLVTTRVGEYVRKRLDKLRNCGKIQV